MGDNTKGTIHSIDETSYSSDSSSEVPNDRTGQILEVVTNSNKNKKKGGGEDVSDVTSTPSEDFTEESEEDGDNSSTSSPCPYTVENHVERDRSILDISLFHKK